ncbi:zinc-binding dehydrogenase [Paramicrobacterium agarici]|uniref:enoyl-[acyl-carrier-protein] reductase n=1 Tax=Paramicrobacterium agarici TaxID=630514 RepID=A0A2A9DTZ4_9MICO|nr:zinc-binding dehydrogenase [Microbacterium agarici]PFG30073.1 NADPH:quinone reductase-like Zn-dependent oxidoreductase [Microbacterium agarici]
MRAIVHHSFAEPESVLTVEERTLPEPGAGQVRVKTILSPIHNHDLWTVRGTYGFVPDLPAQAGTEAVGTVEALGHGVEGLEVGQRVVSGGTFGVWAEYFTAKASGLIPVPAGLPDEAAAQLVAMPLSALSLLHSLGLDEGQWMAQNAANGAVGRLVAQLAAARGIGVVGLVRRQEAVDQLHDQGITNVISTADDGWQDRVTTVTGGAPIVAGVDSVGGAAASDMISLLAEKGTLIAFGAMDSPALEISSGDLIFRQITVTGFWGSVVNREMDAATRADLFAELLARVSSGKLTLPVAAVYSFDDVREAVAASLAPGRVGKVLLKP